MKLRIAGEVRSSFITLIDADTNETHAVVQRRIDQTVVVPSDPKDRWDFGIHTVHRNANVLVVTLGKQQMGLIDIVFACNLLRRYDGKGRHFMITETQMQEYVQCGAYAIESTRRQLVCA